MPRTKWDVLWCLQSGSSRTLFANSAGHAVEEWAYWYEHHWNEYSIVDGEPKTVWVRQHGTEEPWQTWQVRGEMIRRYIADLVEES